MAENDPLRAEVERRAVEAVRAFFVPLYPSDKPIDEMTPYERGLFRTTVPLIVSVCLDLLRRWGHAARCRCGLAVDPVVAFVADPRCAPPSPTPMEAMQETLSNLVKENEWRAVANAARHIDEAVMRDPTQQEPERCPRCGSSKTRGTPRPR